VALGLPPTADDAYGLRIGAGEILGRDGARGRRAEICDALNRIAAKDLIEQDRVERAGFIVEN
jgi:hypothetical protein